MVNTTSHSEKLSYFSSLNWVKPEFCGFVTNFVIYITLSFLSQKKKKNQNTSFYHPVLATAQSINQKVENREEQGLAVGQNAR